MMREEEFDSECEEVRIEDNDDEMQIELEIVSVSTVYCMLQFCVGGRYHDEGNRGHE